MKTLLVAALLSGCAALTTAASAQAQGDAQTTGGQLLVMLPIPPPHWRAGAGYGAAYPLDAGAPARRRIAQALAREHGLRVVDSWPMPVIGVDCFVMAPAAGSAAGAASGPVSGRASGPVLDALGRDPRVAWAQPVNAFHGEGAAAAAASPADPLYPIQPAAAAWRLTELHRVSTGRGVRVAVVDSGVDARHPDLAGQVELQENFVDTGPVPAEDHGTAVAGILAARAGNGVGIAGVAPDARLMALRACWQAPGQGASCSSFTLGKALNFAIQHGARVINLSLAGPPDPLLQALLVAADAGGAAVVGAADPNLPGGGFPASSPVVLAVDAERPLRPPPAARVLLAPGTDIPTCLPGARWGLVSGASYASAHVSGLLALLAQLQPAATPLQLKRDILTVRVTPTLRRTAQTAPQAAGAASIAACATIARAASSCACDCSPAAAIAAPAAWRRR